MYSIGFPEMFVNNKTVLLEDHQATASNLKLLLLSDKMSLIGDPYFGSNLKRYLYSQSLAIKDVLIDSIQKAIIVFMPQLNVSRNDIKISVKKNVMTIRIKCINNLDYTTNLYEISLNSTEKI